MKEQIQLKLAANIIIDKCAHCERLVFCDAWCTQERVIRFTTPFFKTLFSVGAEGEGKWGSGDFAMFEAYNSAESFKVKCALDVSSAPAEQKAAAGKIIAAFGASRSEGGEFVIKEWILPSAAVDPNGLFGAFDSFLAKDLPAFEREVSGVMSDRSAALKEGAESKTSLNKFERNQKARAVCLAFHGTACAVCGIDFGKAYGPEFAGKIEVHHIVPLSEIGEEYVVDPVRDLVPVCPNCHSALHSKPGGTYTVRELKKLMNH